MQTRRLGCSVMIDLGLRPLIVLLFAMSMASNRRGKQHDPDRHLGLSHPAAFPRTDEDFRRM